MIAVLRIIAAALLVYMAWVIFRVVYDWTGIVVAITSVILLPLSIPVVAVAMFAFPSAAAGALSLWPAILSMAALNWLAKKLGGSLLLRT